MKISSRFEFIAEFSWNLREIWRLYSWWAIPLKVKKVLVYLTCWARGKARRLYSRPQRNWKERNIMKKEILLLLFTIVFESDLNFIFSYKNNYNTTLTIKNSRCRPFKLKLYVAFEVLGWKNMYSFSSTPFHTCFLAPVPSGNHMVNGHSYNDNFRPKVTLF